MGDDGDASLSAPAAPPGLPRAGAGGREPPPPARGDDSHWSRGRGLPPRAFGGRGFGGRGFDHGAGGGAPPPRVHAPSGTTPLADVAIGAKCTGIVVTVRESFGFIW